MIKDGLRPSLFWDVDFNQLDVDAFPAFVTIRVMEHGTREEVRAVWNYFGREKVKRYLLEARSLHPKTIAFFSHVLQLNRFEFRSFENRGNDTNWP
jgi:hypothetical protein